MAFKSHSRGIGPSNVGVGVLNLGVGVGVTEGVTVQGTGVMVSFGAEKNHPLPSEKEYTETIIKKARTARNETSLFQLCNS